MRIQGTHLKIYMAASFNAVALMRKIADEIEADGRHTVTSRWIRQPEDEQSVVDGVVTDRVMAIRHARQDMDDIRSSDLVALFTHVRSSSGGLHWEYGYSVSQHKRIVLIGPEVNVFMALPLILERFRRHEDFLNWLKS